MSETNNIGWRKSSRCGSNACVEVNQEDPDLVWVRDSKEAAVRGTAAAILTYRQQEWKGLVSVADQPEFIVALEDRHTVILRQLGEVGVYSWIDSNRPDATLEFTEDEVMAFNAGIRAGEFDV